jgi:hypothetical protein
MIEAWDSFAFAAEAGYEGLYEEYVHDLQVRDLLEELRGGLPRGELLAAITKRIRGIDAHFKDATVEVMRPIMNRPDGDWWWWRVPSHEPPCQAPL